jgi:hypothetical protein
VLLFCLASGTEWAEAGITGATVTAMVVRGLVDRDSVARLVLTRAGRAVLDARWASKAGWLASTSRSSHDASPMIEATPVEPAVD